ncbi:Cu-Zn family superoxide dismutase [Blastomonas natatoria]|uniref:Cu-Zn family superoxide dismutase n=1 Tax=Blastomonas natatoria TaxID=34015 RepID=A0A2V3V052_9SPHN|nr:superoxide dismutase family protein [Blastomonas natatoria]PXW74474.1 Cu-Zn family superoxide dismutase [Blastomonas natatoria]
MTLPHQFFTVSALACSLALAACGNETPEPAPQEEADRAYMSAETAPAMATAMLKTADGADAGMVTATQGDDGIKLTISASGMSAGEHGIHVHTTGKCEGPSFESAGGHWNPMGAKHGLSNPQGQHHGDMPNLVVASDGSGKMDTVLSEAQLDEMLDADGAALVVHAKADDQITDPSGDSGDRVACGVFARS